MNGEVEVNQELAGQLHAAVIALLRWGSRPAVREQLWPGGQSFVPTPTDAWLLEALASSAPARLTTLARWQGVDKSTMTLQVRRLLTAGLVERTPDPSDGRASLVRLTTDGQQVLDRVQRSGTALLAQQLAGWSEADRAELTDLLGRFAADLSIEREEPGAG